MPGADATVYISVKPRAGEDTSLIPAVPAPHLIDEVQPPHLELDVRIPSPEMLVEDGPIALRMQASPVVRALPRIRCPRSLCSPGMHLPRTPAWAAEQSECALFSSNGSLGVQSMSEHTATSLMTSIRSSTGDMANQAPGTSGSASAHATPLNARPGSRLLDVSEVWATSPRLLVQPRGAHPRHALGIAPPVDISLAPATAPPSSPNTNLSLPYDRPGTQTLLWLRTALDAAFPSSSSASPHSVCCTGSPTATSAADRIDCAIDAAPAPALHPMPYCTPKSSENAPPAIGLFGGCSSLGALVGCLPFTPPSTPVRARRSLNDPSSSSAATYAAQPLQTADKRRCLWRRAGVVTDDALPCLGMPPASSGPAATTVRQQTMATGPDASSCTNADGQLAPGSGYRATRALDRSDGVLAMEENSGCTGCPTVRGRAPTSIFSAALQDTEIVLQEGPVPAVFAPASADNAAPRLRSFASFSVARDAPVMPPARRSRDAPRAMRRADASVLSPPAMSAFHPVSTIGSTVDGENALIVANLQPVAAGIGPLERFGQRSSAASEAAGGADLPQPLRQVGAALTNGVIVRSRHDGAQRPAGRNAQMRARVGIENNIVYLAEQAGGRPSVERSSAAPLQRRSGSPEALQEHARSERLLTALTELGGEVGLLETLGGVPSSGSLQTAQRHVSSSSGSGDTRATIFANSATRVLDKRSEVSKWGSLFDTL